MIREIITPQSQEYLLRIPKEYINTKVEFLILPFVYPKQEEKAKSRKDIFDKTVGILSSRNINPIKWQDEIRQEWERE